MRRTFMLTMMAVLLALPMAGQAAAGHPHDKRVKGPNCGDKFINADECSFRYEGGQLYLGGSIRGPVPSSSTATIRLEARSRITGTRYLLLSCTYVGGGCSAGGSYGTFEDLKRGQRLYCTAEGAGRGIYDCGTLIKKHRS